MESKFNHIGIKPVIQKWKSDYVFKTFAGSLLSFGVTVLFALYNGFLGIRLLSVWHGSICVFYLLLVLIRGIILLTERNSKAMGYSERTHGRYRTFVISVTMLLLLNLALICPIALMVKFEKPVNMGRIPAIAMATYTTCKITMASVHIYRQRRKRHNNIFVTELRTINLIDALVSVLTLQNTLIMVNRTKSDTDSMLILSAVSSAVIYIIIVVITICLFVSGIRKYRKTDGCGKS